MPTVFNHTCNTLSSNIDCPKKVICRQENSTIFYHLVAERPSNGQVMSSFESKRLFINALYHCIDSLKMSTKCMFEGKFTKGY